MATEPTDPNEIAAQFWPPYNPEQEIVEATDVPMPEPHPNELVGKTLEQWRAEREPPPVKDSGSG